MGLPHTWRVTPLRDDRQRRKDGGVRGAKKNSNGAERKGRQSALACLKNVEALRAYLKVQCDLL